MVRAVVRYDPLRQHRCLRSCKMAFIVAARHWVSLAIFASATVFVSSCSEPPGKAHKPPKEVADAGERAGMCNTDMAAVRAYFARLDLHLQNSTHPMPLDFYTDVVTLTEHGRTLSFPATEMGPQARRLPTREDWREISRRGSGSLQDAGYRGCHFSTGKAWFDVNYADGRFALRGFDKDRDWSPD